MARGLGPVHHVSVSVSNRDRSATWYCEVLWFEEDFREEGDERRAAILRGADGRSSLAVTEHVGSSSNDDAFEPSRIGLDHLAFTVASLDELHEWADRLTDQGIEHSGVIEIPPGAILNLKDPDGIALALFWDRI
jgi:catechol 2,3-dioxygenase-like lactoylglutathione lyase family enzyme